MTHVERYQHLVFLSNQQQPKDIQYKAAFFVLSSNEELFTLACNEVDHCGIHFNSLKQKSSFLGESDQKLIELAHNIFSANSSCSQNPFWTLSQLEPPQFLCAIQALGIAGEKLNLTIEQGEFVIDDTPLQNQLAFYAQIEAMSKASHTPNIAR